MGVFYIAKLSASAVLDLWDGVQAFILPKIWRRDLRRFIFPGFKYLMKYEKKISANLVHGLWLRGALGESAESTHWVLPGGGINILS